MLNFSEKSQNNFSQNYQKLLNNLLDLKGRDQTIFTKVNSITSFDIFSKFGKSHSTKIFSQKSFTLNFKEEDLQKLLETLKISKNASEIIESYEKYKEKLFKTTRLKLENPFSFWTTKKELIDKLELKIQKTSARWQQFRRKVIDMNMQDNIWPLHIATCFVSIKINTKEIYAPFILKKVEINITATNIYIKTIDSDWCINEKLVFFLNNWGFDVKAISSLNDLSTVAIFTKFSNFFNEKITLNFFDNEFNNKKNGQIKNKKIIFHPGLVLGLFKPAGGHLRKTMLSIIKNREIDDIIDPEPNKNIYKEKINHYLNNSSDQLLRIQPSNFSQDRALISSLLQNTIIWGPPGTGKSQVITNIIANILYQEKTAIVISQKKAALDVLKKRLGKISPFVFFALNNNKMQKADFYKPLQKLIKLIENVNFFQKYRESNKIISNFEIEALKTISNIKTTKNYLPSLELFDIFGKDEKNYFNFFHLSPDLEYPAFNFTGNSSEIKEYVKLLAKTNNIAKKGFWIFKWYPSYIKVIGFCVVKIMNKYPHFDLNLMKQNVDKTNFATIEKLFLIPAKLKRKQKYKSDELFLKNSLAKKVLNKITLWQSFDKLKYKQYKRFAGAIRAARRLSHKFINDHLSIIKELFPIIITTPETSFINWKKNSFEYVVLDESSQIFLEIGLPVLYLAKTKILAGDREQMQPSRWFSTRDDSESIEQEDVLENTESLLDYVFYKGVYQVMLEQNYRSSSASLMSFSSKHFYNSQLEIIDNFKIKKQEKAIEVINVQGQWIKGINEVEAERAISLANLNLNKYPKIVILTFNAPQRQFIEKNILEKHPKLFEAIENENLFIRNIENIQGDEANLVIISIVYDDKTKISSTYVARTGGKNALNVAISRAKDKMIIVKSITFNDLSQSLNSQDFQIFKKWIAFLDMNEITKKSYSSVENKITTMSEDVFPNFELEVFFYLKENLRLSKKIKLIRQYAVGSKNIDIALVNELSNNFLMGIKVDDYKYYGKQDINKYLSDYACQEFLEIKGYLILRIQEIDWKLDKKKIVKNIEVTLENLIFKTSD